MPKAKSTTVKYEGVAVRVPGGRKSLSSAEKSRVSDYLAANARKIKPSASCKIVLFNHGKTPVQRCDDRHGLTNGAAVARGRKIAKQLCHKKNGAFARCR